MAPFPTLRSPFSIRDVELRNRLVFQPHYTALGRADGTLSEALIAYHVARARGGAGLIVFESQAVHPSGKMSRWFIHAWDPVVVPGYRRLTDAVHEHGAKIFGQLTHGGHTSLVRIPDVMWAPTQMPEPSSNFSTKAMDEDDIRVTIEGFGSAARNALEGGFDGVEIKVAHDGLLRSFASPFFNRRRDRYGGSFENRMRLSIEVLEAIKSATRDDFPVGVRLCLHEYTSFGYELDYGLRMAEALEATGLVDYFNSDAGSFSSYWMEIPPFAIPEGNFKELSAALKRASDLPVVAFGRIKRPAMAEEILATGDADLIGMARQLIADPETGRKIEEDRAGEIRFCIGCNDACIREVGLEKPIRCVHNPAAGRELEVSERELPAVRRARDILVVGGGPAGLKFAEIAARRGHRVTLVERAQALGGQLLLAARQPLHAEVVEVVGYLEQAVRGLGVDLRLGVDVTPERVRDLDADVIVVATGSQPNLPQVERRAGDPDAGRLARELGRQQLDEIPGLELEHVFSVDEVLAGAVLPGRRVVLVDGNGHWEAAGTAEFLADAGHEVHVVTRRPMVGSELEGTSQATFTLRSAKKAIRSHVHEQLVAVEEGRVRVRSVLTGAEREIEADTVVPVLGRRSREDLFLELSRADGVSAAEVLRVGDCVAPRLIQSVIFEAYLLARTLRDADNGVGRDSTRVPVGAPR